MTDLEYRQDEHGVGGWRESNGGSQPYKQAVIPVTAAQILDLAAHPVTLITSPGPDKLVLPIHWAVALTFATTPYTYHGDVVRGDWSGQPLGSQGGFLTTDQVFFAVDNEFVPSFGPINAAAFTLSTPSFVGQDFNLCIHGSDLTDGDSDVVVAIEYTIIDLA